MKFEKTVIAHLNKCYSIAPLTYHGTGHFLVAAEKDDPCLLFDMDGQLKETIWDSPGGVMSMVQLPGSDGQFLATQKFYSPNDSADAGIILASPTADGTWIIKTICHLPFVHRFDILTVGSVHYLIACTLKSGHTHKDDWSMPGKVYAAALPDCLDDINEENPLILSVIKDNMPKNHGYNRVITTHGCCALISSEAGIFLFMPPCDGEDNWIIKQLLTTPASDAALIDLDNDQKAELITISPFHGSQISIYKEKEGCFEHVYSYEQDAEFSHAIWTGSIAGKNTAIIGHRNGKQQLLLFQYNQTSCSYDSQVIDSACGPANAAWLEDDSHSFLVSANRETDEIAIYRLLPD